MTFNYQQELQRGFYTTSLIAPNNCVSVKQVHGHHIVNILEANEQTEADGIYWFWEEIDAKIPTIFTADCLPILIEGAKGGAILHAGWRGVHQRIHLQPIIYQLEPQTAVIGPSIQVNAFEVQADFFPNFPDSPHFTQKNGKTYFNLQAKVQGDLREAFPEIKIIDSEICTFTNTDYNSYRRNPNKKRNYNYYQMK